MTYHVALFKANDGHLRLYSFVVISRNRNWCKLKLVKIQDYHNNEYNIYDWNNDYPHNEYQGHLWLGRCGQNLVSSDGNKIKLVRDYFGCNYSIPLWSTDELIDIRDLVNDISNDMLCHVYKTIHHIDNNELSDNVKQMTPIWMPKIGYGTTYIISTCVSSYY